MRQNFGRNLKNVLIAYVVSGIVVRNGERGSFREFSAGSLPPQFATIMPRIGFDLKAIEYGSLDLTLAITGIKQLAGLFDDNFDVFMMFMHGYLPLAFESTLSPLDLNSSGLRFDVIPNAALIASFMANGASGATAQETSTATGMLSKFGDRTRSLWFVANGTLVVPVLLAMAVFYVALKNIADERIELQAIRKDMLARQQAAEKVHADRIADLEKTQVELLKLLRVPETGVAEKK